MGTTGPARVSGGTDGTSGAAGAPESGRLAGPASVSEASAGWDAARRLRIRRLLPLLWRSFFLQAAWSYERMQSVGFAAAVSGEGRRLTRGGDGREYLRRHLAFFNTNPVLASYVIGGVVRLEEEVLAGRLHPDTVARFKSGLVSPLASWGDTLFWATLRPAATLLGAAAGWLAGVPGVLLYLLAYNALHIYYRVRGLSEGYRFGPQLKVRLGQAAFRRMPEMVRGAALLTAGALLALGVAPTRACLGTTAFVGVVAAAAAAFLAFRRWQGGGSWWGLAALGVGLAYAWLAGAR